MKLKRSLYLAYYLKKLERDTYNLFLDYVHNSTGLQKKLIIKDIIKSIYLFNISILEYFQFRFYELNHNERLEWAGTGYMYEYQLMMNPKKSRDILDDKRKFYKHYRDFLIHEVADLTDLKDTGSLRSLLSNPSRKIVFKAPRGKCGKEVEIRDCVDFVEDDVIEYMKRNNYGLAEEFIIQHPELNRLSPSAVNTVRIITQLNEFDEVDVLGCRLRISVDSPVDNMAAGNLAAVIDEDSGTVTGPGVYSDITKSETDIHPVTNVKITGFKIPFWKETLAMAKQAALLHPQNRSIGWDIVITEKGPGLIEGNHDWCKLLWQLPVQNGLKHILEDYKESFSKPVISKKMQYVR